MRFLSIFRRLAFGSFGGASAARVPPCNWDEVEEAFHGLAGVR